MSAALLTTSAVDVRPGDSLWEGYAVIAVHHRAGDFHDEATGVTSFDQLVDVQAVPARWSGVEWVNGVHVHEWDRSALGQRTYRASDAVRIVRPAPMAPCTECGFDGKGSE